MKIALVSRFPPPLDGQAIAAERIAAMLRGAHDVACIDLNASGGRLMPNANPLVRGGAVLRRLGRSVKVIRAYQPDVMIYNALSATLPGAFRDLATLMSATPRANRTVGVLHNGNWGLHSTSVSDRLAATLCKRVSRHLDMVICLSESLASGVRRIVGEDHVRTIPNTVTGPLACAEGEVADATAARAAADDTRVLFVGNLHLTKGFESAARGVQLLRRGRPDFHAQLRIIGDYTGPASRAAIEQLLAEAEGIGGLDVAGPVRDQQSLKNSLLSAHVLVLPTRYPFEAQPLVILEAMAAGVPVVATRQGGIPDIITDGIDGILMNDDSPEQVAQAIERVRSDWQRFSVAARRKYNERYTMDVVRSQWLAALAEFHPEN